MLTLLLLTIVLLPVRDLTAGGFESLALKIRVYGFDVGHLEILPLRRSGMENIVSTFLGPDVELAQHSMNCFFPEVHRQRTGLRERTGLLRSPVFFGSASEIHQS
jgi:hypothetical protein